MTLDELLTSLFGDDRDVTVSPGKVAHGTGRLDGRAVAIVGIVEGTPLGIEAALAMAGHVEDILAAGDATPILVLVDTASQAMRRHDEMLGLDEYLAHLAKSLIWAAQAGHATIGLLYGNAAAGAFIATALATRHLVALPGANPFVMDLPSIARVTKLPLEKLKAMANDTPVFAPGLEPLRATGAIQEVWDPARSFSDELRTTLQQTFAGPDTRDELGRDNGGRLQAAAVARRVMDELLGE